MTLENSLLLNRHLDFYGELGFNVIPVFAPSNGNPKMPALDEWTTYTKRLSSKSEHALWWKYSDVERNIGVVTGGISGNLLVVDIDDADTYNVLQDSHPRFKDTLTCKTGKGYHLYYYLDDEISHRTITFQYNGKTHHLKGEASMVVAPPSIHPNGNRYEFIEMRTPSYCSFSTIKASLADAGCNFTSDEKELRDRPITWASGLVKKIDKGERNTRAAQLCGLLIRKFMHDPSFILGLMEAWNHYYCDPPLSTRELENLVSGEYRRYGPNGG